MLTPAQIEARRGKLTASRVAVLMNGDAEGILRLYREMIGEEQEENLDDVWPVQLGIVTEELNLRWYERNSGSPVTRRGEVVVHPKYPWAACTLDGYDIALNCPIETKHVGGRKPLEVIIERYSAQMSWQMACTESKQCALSVIMGANAPIVEYIDRDDAYIAEMLSRGQQFMGFVEARIPPVVLPPVPAPIVASKEYDMTGQNRWAANAVAWLETRDAAKRCKDSELILKALVPDDAKKCHGHGVRISRDRAGRLSLREDA